MIVHGHRLSVGSHDLSGGPAPKAGGGGIGSQVKGPQDEVSRGRENESNKARSSASTRERMVKDWEVI